jgi:putative ATPase
LQLGFAKDYRYAHNEDQAFATGEKYFPDEMDGRLYYHPVDQGFETRIAEKLKGPLINSG